MTARLLAVTALLALILRVRTRGHGLRWLLGRLAWSMVVTLAPLLWDDDRSSTFDSLDLDRDDSFRAVLHLIREFHSLEEPASVALKRCKTSLTPVYGLQSESSPLFACLFPPYCSLSLRILTRLWPSLWKTRPYMVSFPFPVGRIGSIIGLPPPLSLVCTQSRPAWP